MLLILPGALSRALICSDSCIWAELLNVGARIGLELGRVLHSVDF